MRFEHPGMRIDLGGIGKGYAVDRGTAILKARGIQHAIVTAGGDSRIIGDHMGRPWMIAIRIPTTRTRWSRASRCPTPRCQPRATTNATSMRTACAITTSSTRAPATRRARFAAPRSSAHRHADRRHVEDRVRARRRKHARDHQPHARLRRGIRQPGRQGAVLERPAPAETALGPSRRPPPPPLLGRAPVADLQQRIHFGLGG